jgi:TP901 family phage tail tape measure protein
VSGATADEFERLNATARQLGATTRFTAKEAAGGLLFLARTGFKTAEAIDAVGATLDLAAAGGIELGEAADFSSNILQAFALEAKQMTRVVDVMVRTTNRANTDVTQLAEAMKLAAPIAGGLGISLEETSAALGVLGDRGIQATLAGTALRGAMLTLTDRTSGMESVLDELNLKFEDVNSETNSLLEIFGRLGKANITVGQATRIFGKRQAAVAIILARNTQRFRELVAENENAAGSAERMAKIMEDTLAGAFRSLRSSIEEAILQTGDRGLTGSLKGMTETLTQAIRILNNTEGAMDDASESARSLAKDMKAVGEAGGFLGKGFLAGVKTATLAYEGLDAALHEVFGDATEEMEEFKQTFRELMVLAGTESIADRLFGPDGPDTVTLFAEAMERARKATEDFGDAAQKSGANVKDMIEAMEQFRFDKDAFDAPTGPRFGATPAPGVRMGEGQKVIGAGREAEFVPPESQVRIEAMFASLAASFQSSISDALTDGIFDGFRNTDEILENFGRQLTQTVIDGVVEGLIGDQVRRAAKAVGEAIAGALTAG